MLAAQGSGLSTVSPTLDPLAPVDVIAGTYTMSAFSPPGLHLVEPVADVVTGRRRHLGRGARRRSEWWCGSRRLLR